MYNRQQNSHFFVVVVVVVVGPKALIVQNLLEIYSQQALSNYVNQSSFCNNSQTDSHHKEF